MINQNVLQAFLKEKGVHCPYQIWLSSPETSEPILLEGEVQEDLVMYIKKDLLECVSYQEVKERETYLYFTYPNQYVLIVCLPIIFEFDDNDMNLLYYFLYPI